MSAKIMTSRRDGICIKCAGRIKAGEMIAYSREEGAAHAPSCPENPEIVPHIGYTKIGTDAKGKDVFGVMITDPEGALDREGQTVTFVTSSGKTVNEQLGECVRTIGTVVAVYRKADRPKVDNAPKLPDGYYALVMEGDSINPVHFYRVRTGKDKTAEGGKDWSGVQFLDRLHGPNRSAVRGRERLDIMVQIAANPAEAMMRYGHEKRRCGRCHLRLTRGLFRYIGIGDDCGEAMYGDAWAEIRSQARDDMRAQGLDPDAESTDEIDEALEQLRLPVNQPDGPGDTVDDIEAQIAALTARKAQLQQGGS